MEWISVKDRLPDQNHDWYLVTDGIDVTIASWDTIHFVGQVLEIKKITHWMPLPEPLKDKMEKFKITEKCIDCQNPLNITSVIDLNGQVNFQCSNEICSQFGFIHNGKIYFSYNDMMMQEGEKDNGMD